MFHLDKKIFEWRQQMLAAGIGSPVPLDELELHLHEDIQEQIRCGSSEQAAFEISVQNIGQPQSIKTEFAKTERKFMKQIIKIGAGIFGVAVGMAFVTPAVAQCRHEGAMANNEVWLYTLGMAINCAGVWLAVQGMKRRKA